MQTVTVLVLAIFHLQESSALSYRAAVVEYSPVTGETPQNTILKNLNNYKIHVQHAKEKNADIIVFPEYGLTTMVEDPQLYSIFVNTSTFLVQELSTLAKKQRIYLIVNLLEKTNTGKYYNTNLVFDRTGSLILMYRKINLFGEPNLEPGSADQNPVFSTDFGVTFGIFTCFDILYRNPSRTVLKNINVTDIVYPTSWFSTMPFYASLNVQHGYSISTGVNLLASNLGQPQNTHGGSGIYLAKNNFFKTHITDVPESKLLTQEISQRTICSKNNQHVLSKKLLESNMTNYQTLTDFRSEDYIFKTIDQSQINQTTSICYKHFCCTFDITLRQTFSSTYKIVAFDGIVPYDRSFAHIRFCSLLLCETDSNDSCGARITSPTIFTKLTVRGELQTNSTTFYNPLTLDTYLRPLIDTMFSNRPVSENKTNVQLSTLTEYENVVVFGIFGRID